MSEIKYSAKDGDIGRLTDITPATVVLKVKNAKGKSEPKVFGNATAAYAYLCTDDEDRKVKLLNTLDIKTLNFLASPRSGFVEPESKKMRLKLKRRVLRAKFVTGHPYFTKLLLDTGDANLIEHRYWEKTDSFWGEAKDGSGRNEHGKLLMEIRDELQEKFAVKKTVKKVAKKVVKDLMEESDGKKKKAKKSSKKKSDLPWDEDEKGNVVTPKKKKTKKSKR